MLLDYKEEVLKCPITRLLENNCIGSLYNTVTTMKYH